MYITIRLDDITPDMDWGKFKRFKEILDKADQKITIYEEEDSLNA